MLRFLTAGESHGPALVAILEGIPAGLPLTAEMIDHELERRQRGFGAGGRMKIEQDRVRILGGVLEGQTTGAPIALLVENRDHSHWKGKAIPAMTAPRPGHADLSGAIKFGYKDLRPALERASARETTMRVAVGAICKQLLGQFGIRIGGYVSAIGGIQGRFDGIPLEVRLEAAEQNNVRCPDAEIAEKMRARIRQIMQEKDTLGGMIEVVALGVPPGLGSFSQWDRRLEARIAQAVLSVPAIKGVEIGEAFENAHLRGTQAQDAILLREGRLVRGSNRAGGIEGGISNGEAILVRAAMKPIATTLLPQTTVDLARGNEALTRYERSDFCPVPRAVPILEAMLAFVLAEALLEKLGGDSLAEMQPRFAALRQATLADLALDDQPHVFWP
ncbi:MAG: chorismate synthase [Anaerolineae bacterium]